jgi:hypothetical protein
MSNKSTIDILRELEADLDTLSRGYLKQESIYITVLRSALVKIFEFNVYLWQDEHEKNSFFSTATLRGICEDIITLNFISTLSDEHKEKIIGNLYKLDLLTTSKKQADFFKKNKPYQPLFETFEDSSKLNSEISQIVVDIKNIANQYSHWDPTEHKPLPSVRQMSKLCNLEELYDYLYAATSRWVHFNTNVLIRMGWGDTNNDPELAYKASTKNFDRYYLDFSRFYAVYLFIKFYDVFHNDLPFTKDAIFLIDELRIFITKTIRWPELITFEEMNIKPPSRIMYALLHAIDATKRDKE